MKLYFVIIALTVASISSCGIKRPNKVNDDVKETSFNKLSQDLLLNLKANKSVVDIQKQLASVSEDELEKGLPLDEQRKAFWLNVYNGYIIAILKKDKSKFCN